MKHYVLFVHGVGEQTPEPPTELWERIRRACEAALARRGAPRPGADALRFDYVYWADVTQPDQEDLKRRLGVRTRLRKFLVGSMGDVVAYSKLSYPPDKYGEVQRRFAESIRRASRAVEQAGVPWAHVTIIAHSLGTVIASDGLYDLMRTGAFPANLRLTNVFTLGSPIALFGLRYGLENFTKPIRPSVWVNFSYPQDLIGYPLKTLNDAYASAVTEDVLLLPSESARAAWSAVRMFAARLPGAGPVLAHSWYFTDPRVFRRIGRTLAEQWPS